MTQPFDYNAKLYDDLADISARVKRGMLPLVARNPALERATAAYALAQADHYAGLRNPPVALRNSRAMDSAADLVLYEELTWSHPDKMAIVEYPVMSDRGEQSYYGKYLQHPDLEREDDRRLGRRKTHFTDEAGTPQVRSTHMPRNHSEWVAEDVIDRLYDALEHAGLTDRQREAVDLHYFGNLTQEAVALEMGVSQPAVFKFLKAATTKLHDYMTKS